MNQTSANETSTQWTEKQNTHSGTEKPWQDATHTVWTIEQRFGAYRKPTDATIPKYTAIQEKTLELAVMIDELCPNSPEKWTALTQLQMAKMSANAAVAIYTDPQ